MDIVARKSLEASATLRQLGNVDFIREDMKKALMFFSQSIAVAPCVGTAVELALAFANRSAVHFTLGNYEDCLSDVEQALKANYPSRLRYKVLKRRAECHREMNNMKEAKKSYKEAIACCLEEDRKQSMEQELAALKPPEQVYKPRLRVRPPPEKYLGDNPMIPGASACMEIKHTKKYGRHLVATQDIPPGVVLLVEDPFASVLEKRGEYCYNCFCRSDAMIPCKSCTLAMFCSEGCRESSNLSHKFACPILTDLRDISLRWDGPLILTLHMFNVVLVRHGHFSGLDDYVKQLKAKQPDGIKGCDDKGRYISTELRAVLEIAHAPVNIDMYAESENPLTHMVRTLIGDFKFVKDLLPLFGSILDWNCLDVEEYGPPGSNFSDRSITNIGKALYPLYSLLNHRCIPNSMHYYRGDTLVLISTLPIVKGEQVFVSYLKNSVDLDTIQKTQKFKCGCRGCTNPLPSRELLPLCPACNHAVPEVNEMLSDLCLHCNNSISFYEQVVGAYVMLLELERMEKEPLVEANAAKISEMITTLHKNVAMANDLILPIQRLLTATLAQGGVYYL